MKCNCWHSSALLDEQRKSKSSDRAKDWIEESENNCKDKKEAEKKCEYFTLF
jgi:hypothetical protein